MRIPADEEIRALHEKYAPAPEALDLVYTHCLIVCGIAEQLHARSGACLDIDLVRAGSLLHDIGVYRLYDEAGELDYANYIRHGVLGHELPPADYIAETVEEVLVMYSDKFHTKTTPPGFLTASTYAASVRRFGEDKVAAFESMRAMFGDPDLAPFIDAYGHRAHGASSAGLRRTWTVRR